MHNTALNSVCEIILVGLKSTIKLVDICINVTGVAGRFPHSGDAFMNNKNFCFEDQNYFLKCKNCSVNKQNNKNIQGSSTFFCLHHCSVFIQF